MKDIIVDEFQTSVQDSLIRHRSILDIMTKLAESNARINRALAKAVTYHGCIKINAQKQHIPEDASLDNITEFLSYQIEGKLCDNCREVLEEEIGNNLFYLAALCNALDLNLFDIILKQNAKLETLGKFSML
ncbi:hypothetical protein SAMN05660865_01209 [Caloramator fervidus]|uniref:DUF1573 domain-containing protein n=1 Tax=Caloramator fervidus TaxID=29344 RepID=A0A1H5VHL8_9CLOT|nr:DUF1573 domain-containing protein [Caloramator fervidus]SEF86819.1 hypothetical protein SAMN05660865_01209 [Caloramator fervidus]